jgi:hypothetical protein
MIWLDVVAIWGIVVAVAWVILRTPKWLTEVWMFIKHMRR